MIKISSRAGNHAAAKYLAHCGVASRRKAEEMILDGAVQVNGQTVREMGIKVGPKDIVCVKGKRFCLKR